MTRPLDPDVTVGPPTLPLPDSPPSPAAPEGVPGYEILGELGRGGMGVVYKARHTALNRVVALKMILAGGHAGEEALARFQTEAEAIARLQHPGIVQVYGVGQHGELPWLSLEFCEGGSLEKRLAGQPQPPAEAAALVEALARAVQAAHEKGVVHRDLKPANVLLSRRASGPLALPPEQAGRLLYDEPKITDFGLAKKLDDASGATRTGSIMGTPSYMAPEQAEAKKDVGPAADIWALGAILYECLTGRPPFRAATPLDTILQVVTDEPVPPSRLVARLPRDLETICLKCLQKDPGRRYASAQALADDLAAFRDGRPIAARPVGRLERAWRWAGRNRAVAVAGLVTLLALIAASVVSTAFGLRATASAELARDEAARAAKHAVEEARQRWQAEELERANRRQVIDLTLSRGQQRLTADDPAGALPWLVEAARLDPDEPLHLRRLDRVLRGLPRPAHLWRMGGSINHLVLSPDGKRVAAADNAGLVRAWNLETGEPVGPELKHPYPVLALAFSPDGRRLATAGGVYLLRGEIRVYDPERGGEPVEKVITGPAAFVLVGFSADGKLLFGADFTVPGGLLAFTGGRGRNTFRAWERATGRPLEEVSSEFRAEPRVFETERAFHRGTGRLLVVENKQARVVELGRKRTAAGPWPHATVPWAARLSPDGRWVTLIGTDGVGKVCDLATGREHTLTVNYPYQPVDIGVYSNEQAAIAFYDGAVHRYQLSTGAPVRASQERPGSPGWACAFSPDGGFFTGQGQDDKVRVWQVPWWAPLSPWLPHGSAVTAGEVAVGGRLLITGTADGAVRAWDLVRSDEPSWTLNDAPFRPADVPFDEKGRAVLVGRGKAMTVDPATGQVAAFTAAENQPGQTAHSPDGKLLAVGTSEGVRLIDTATGKDLRPPLKMGLPIVLDLEFSPDGRWLAARAARTETRRLVSPLTKLAMNWRCLLRC
jgi:eukaryotic-like serine/threonine-protein kinase